MEFPELSPKMEVANDEGVGKSWRNGLEWTYRQVVGAIWDKEGEDRGNNMGLQNKGRCKVLVKGGIWWEGGIEKSGVR